MYGIVVHANTISMILNEDYVNEWAGWQENLIAFLVVFLNVLLFAWINRKHGDWFDMLTLLAQIIEVLLLSFLMIELFNSYSFKLNLTVTLAGVALVGTCFELYEKVFKLLFFRLKERLFTKRQLAE
jgi:CHASE2 domain-containing sensor protein